MSRKQILTINLNAVVLEARYLTIYNLILKLIIKFHTIHFLRIIEVFQ